MRCIAGLLVALALAACSSSPPKERLVEVPVVVGVPENLTLKCDVAMPNDSTVEELLRVAKKRRTSLEQCNNKLEAIKNLK
ncbi:hypothetical protein [Xanthomonas phage DES1]|nr:hypothetical protein [Xanthomonas phage DES1]